MISAIVFDNEITVYWDRPDNFIKGYSYSIFVNDKLFAETTKTHCELFNLVSMEKYKIKVELRNSIKQCARTIGIKTFTTKRSKKMIDITKPPYNAVGDGKTLNTILLQKALDSCNKNNCLYFPEGEYLTGALNIGSNTEIYLEKGCVIKGTTDPADYLPMIDSRFEGAEMKCYASLLNIGTLNRNKITCKNIVIRGGGKIYGGGRKLADNIIAREKIKLKEYMASLGDSIKDYETTDTIPGRLRGRLVNISSCENVILSNVELFDGPSWNTHFIYSKNVITNRCKIGSKIVKNGDGWDPDSSVDCTIFDCDFNTSDDSIAIKSGKNPEGNEINKPSENIKIFDCRVSKGGGIAIGSEMSGGVKNVKIWDIDCTKAQVGLTIKTAEKRGGYINNIKVFDSIFPSVYITASVNYNNDGENAKQYGDIGEFYFENLVLTGKGYVFFNDVSRQNKQKEYSVPPIYICGLDNKIIVHNVTFKNCIIERNTRNDRENCSFDSVKDLTISDIQVK